MYSRKPRLLNLALLACGLASAQARGMAQNATLARTGYETDAHGTIYLRARVNDKAEARFMLDTGSNTFCSDALIARMGLATRPLRGADGAQAKFEDGSPIQTVTLNMAVSTAPLTFSGNFMALPASVLQNMGVQCDGIIGADGLRGLSLYLNPASRQVAILQAGHLDAPALRRLGMEGVKPVPLTHDGLYTLPVEIPGIVTVPMMLDTGREFSQFSPDTARKISKDWRAYGKVGVAQGVFQSYTTRLDRVKVGDNLVRGQRAVYTEQAPLPIALLGRDFLSRFAMLVDFPAGKVYLKPLGTGPGISPFARRRLGEDAGLPGHIITFPYGGRAVSAGGGTDYKPGFSAAFPPDTDVTQFQIIKNPPPADAYSRPVEIAFTGQNNAIVLPMTLEGKPARMALDTGSIGSWLTTGAAARLGVKPGRTVDDGQEKTGQAILNSLALSPAAPDFLAYCDGFIGDRPRLYRLTDAPLPPEADGIVGLDYLSTQTFGLDMAARKLVAWPLASQAADRLRWVANGSEPVSDNVAAISLTHEVDDWYYADATLNGQTLKVIVDTALTGAGRLPDNITPADYGLTLEPASGTPQAGTGRDTSPAERRGVLKDLRIGGLTLDTLTVGYVTAQGAQSLPLLGLDAFKGRRMLFDLPNNTLYVSKKPQP